MTLDKQKILNELGSVVDQLQGADCGCMGKIFSNCTHQNNSGNSPSYGGGGCGSCGHHCRGHQHQGWGQNAPCGGEPHSNQSYMNASSAQMNAVNPQMNACNPQMAACNPQMNACNPQMNACNPQMNACNPQQNACNPQMNACNPQMSACNPQKLYADTYKYLNQNLMQPVLREVYNDLKSITPANTIANNPIASQLGLTGNASPDQNANMNNAMAHSQMAGGEMNALAHNQMTGGGNMPHNQMTAGGMNHIMPQNQMTAGGMSNRMPQHQMYESGGNMYGNTQENTTVGNMSQNINPTQQMGNMGATPMHQQMTPHHNQPKQGQQGIGMFNSMFPGVMQGLGGDLDFDPMAIAVQMNPSNQQRAAMDSMNKMMMGNKEGIGKILNKTGDSLAMQPAIKGANAAASLLSQNQPAQMQQNTTAYHAAPMQQNAPAAYQQMQQNAPTAYQQMQQNAPTAYQQVQQNTPTAYQQIAPSVYPPAQQNVQTGYQQMTPTHDVGPAYQTGQQQPSASMGEAPPQQVYTAYNGAPMMNQQEMQRDMHHPQYQQINPRAPPVPAYEGSGDPNAQNVHSPQYHKEPIFPAEPSRQAYYSAQQVKQLPTRIYQEQQPLPTQRMPTRMHDPMTYSNVKSTVSKTSLMGMKRIGNVPSRSQLQHIYNQYKGSHSFTQQNVRPTERTTHSAGSLNVSQMLPAPVQVPIERVAGDTINNQINRQFVNKVDHVIGRMGDVPANNKPMDNIPKEEPPTRQSRCRNGLQDVVFTSYPSSAAWSFHGNHGNRLRA